jgi:drug/metabolite transporter (DMT)-like permease
MSVILAIAAAFVYGSGVALQQHAALQVPSEHALRLGLLARLVRQPLWLAGLAAEIVGFALQVAALQKGSLIVVQPILTIDLVFTLAIAAAWSHQRLHSREWLGVGCTIVGVSTFLIAANPSPHSSGVGDTRGWLLCAFWIIATTGIAAAYGLWSSGTRRSWAFGIAAGIANGFMAVVAKAFGGKLESGLGATLRSWQVWALIAAGVVAMLLMQTAYQSGHPTITLPVINVVDPLVSSLVGVTLFGETVDVSGGRAVAVAAAIAIMGVGLMTLGRTPLVLGEQQEPAGEAVQWR